MKIYITLIGLNLVIMFHVLDEGNPHITFNIIVKFGIIRFNIKILNNYLNYISLVTIC